MEQKIYNLDEEPEFFEFIIKGHTYRFRHLTSEEAEELQSIQSSDSKLQQEFFLRFIEKTKEDQPDFIEISKKMNLKHWAAFNKMIVAEMTENAGS